MRPPSRAPTKAITIVDRWMGALRCTVVATVADVVWCNNPLTLEAPTARPVLDTLSAGPTAPMIRQITTPTAMPMTPPTTPIPRVSPMI